MNAPRRRVNDAGQPIGDPVEGSPRPRVEPVTLVGRTCRVEPWTRDQLPALYDALCVESPASTWTYLPVGPYDADGELGDWLDELAADPGSVPHAVIGPDGRPVGVASYLRLDEANGSVEVGAIVLGAALQRSTAATEAMFLMMRHAFDGLGYRRYEWKCDSLNGPSRAAALRLGFSYEGTFRNAVLYKGRTRDTDWFSVIDSEWPALRAGFEAWLDPENFDPDGGQRAPLRARQPSSGTPVPDDGTPGRLS